MFDHRHLRTVCASLLLSISMAACGGGGASPPPPRSAGIPQAATKIPVTFRIGVSTTTTSKSRKPFYLSPATESISIVVTPQGGSPQPAINAALTPTSNGCSSTLATTICSVVFDLAPGSYGATMSTYDQTPNAQGLIPVNANLLSQNQALSFAVVAGQTNTISVTLFGIPSTIQLVPDGASTNVIGSHATGYGLIGTSDVAFDIVAVDADGNIIAGPGSPQYTVSSNGTQIAVDAEPSTSQPNRVLLRGPAFSETSATVSTTVTNASSFGETCSACSDSVPVSAGALLLNGGDLLAGNTSLATIGTPTGSLYSSSYPQEAPNGDIFALEGNETVPIESQPPFQNSSVLSALPSNEYAPLVSDANGKLYFTINNPEEFSGNLLQLGSSVPPYTTVTPEYTIPDPPLWSTIGTYFDQQALSLTTFGGTGACFSWYEFGYIAPAFQYYSRVAVRMPGSSQWSEIFSMQFSQSYGNSGSYAHCYSGYDGSLIVAYQTSATTDAVVVYQAPSYTPITYTYSGTSAVQATMDPAGRLYLASGSSVSELNAPYTSIAVTQSVGVQIEELLAPTTDGVFVSAVPSVGSYPALGFYGTDLSLKNSYPALGSSNYIVYSVIP